MRTVAAVALVLTGALLVSEAAMQPSAADRVQLVSVFGGVAAVAAVLAYAFRRWRPASLGTAVVTIALLAVGVAGAAVAVSASSMFLSSHDLKLVLVALGLGVTLGVVVAISLTRDLQRDLAAIRETARAVAAGDRTTRTGVDRRDEIGVVAATLDEAVTGLALADAERDETDAARRRFLANVGHDLRTPLTSLRSAIEAFQDGLVDDPDRYLDAMGRDVDLLSSLVEDLFLLARIESGGLELERQSIDLAELADGVLEAARPNARARQIRLTLGADRSVPVVGSPRELSRVLRNLVDNAVRHSPPGSTVRVEVRADDAPTVTVTDEGPGFAEDFVELAFDSFTRADEARTRDGSGAGLGLAIARGLVHAHGGEITARPGPGGTVTVRLPGPAGRAHSL